MAATLGAISFSKLHERSVARTEGREKKAIGKMASSDIIGYLCYRHRGMLLTTALIATNILWVLHYSVHQ
jgi:hypothetical protein